jgi:hypothetical protein
MDENINTSRSFTKLLIFSSIGLSVAFYYIAGLFYPKIKVGQMYKEVSFKDNPYRKPIVDYKRVIDIKGDYVLFIQNGEDTLSDSKRWFTVGSVLMENYQFCN